MKISLSNLKLVKGKAGPKGLLRFDLTILQNDDTPGLTLSGCLFTPEENIQTPSIRWGRMQFPKELAQLADNIKTDIRETIKKNAAHLVAQLPPPNPYVMTPKMTEPPDMKDGGKLDV